MQRPLQLPFRIALAAAALLSLALLCSASGAAAAGCGHIKVDVSKHRVKPGQVLRVSGTTCATRSERPRVVRIKLRTKHGWRKIGVSHTRATGHFSRKVKVRVPEGQLVAAKTSTARLQVVASKAQSPSVPIRVTDPAPPCPLQNPAYEVGSTLEGCRVLFNDTASAPDAAALWGRADCGTFPNAVDQQRPLRLESGGDTHLTGTGAPQENGDYRRMTVFDGDNYYGERCELGFNNSEEGPTALYHEGQRRVTYASIRLPENFPLDTTDWQTILQMKQAQPANNGGGVPILFMGAHNGMFVVDSDHGEHWEFPAQKNVWTRFMFDVTYSQDPSKGSIQVDADLNDDGDFNDPGERSPRIQTATLRAETAGPLTNIAPGESIPDHLRVGIYHDPEIPCPPPTGCSTEVDNVQVLGS